jgi:predicted ATP-grasp superfamily ATP-dependent carboligase
MSNPNAVMTAVEKSGAYIGTNGEFKDLEISGPKKQQIQQAVEYFQDLQTELCNEVDSKEKLTEEVKKVQQLIKTSPLMAKLKNLKKDLRSRSLNITEINSRRSGALGLCKKQGLDLGKVLKNVVQIEGGK